MMSGSLPLLGHVLDFRKGPLEFLENGRKAHGDIFRMKFPTIDTTVFSGLAGHEAFFRMPDDVVSQREVYQMMVPIFGKGIVYDVAPEIMREQLAFLHPALKEARLKTYASAFVEEAELFFEKWGDEGVVDLYDTANELTIYTSSRCLLGKDFRSKLSHEFAELYHTMERGLTLVSLVAPYAPTPAHLRRNKARARMGVLIKEIIQERRAQNRSDNDVLQTFIEAKYSDGRQVPDEEIVGLLLAIVFAGHHTSGTTFTWNTVRLQQHPQYLARVMQEQKDVLEGKSEVGIDSIRSMQVLERSIKETLRLHPPIIMVMRRVLKEFDWNGYVVPKGGMVLCSPLMSGRNEEIFKDPNTYDPDRFGPGREEDKVSPLAWIPFGGGRHRCLGTVFAMLQLVATNSVLLRHFDIELVEPEYATNFKKILAQPYQPCRVRYKRKKKPFVQVAA